MQLFNTLIGASGYFIPILLLFCALGQHGIWRLRRRTIIYGIVFSLILLGFVIGLHDVSVSRYLFIPVVLCSLFCGSGISGIQRLLPKIHPRLILALICVVICGGALLQILMRDRKNYISDFAKIIQQHTPDGARVVLYGQHSDQDKVALILQAQGIDCASISENIPIEDFIFDTVIQAEWQKTEIFFLIGIPQQSESESWIKDFRSVFYVAPFDLLGQSSFRKRKQLLFHFNRRTGDGTDVSLQTIADLTPSEIDFDPTSLNSVQLQNNDLIRSTGAFILPQCNIFSSTLYGMLRVNGKNRPIEHLKLNYCNGVFWPEISLKYIPDADGRKLRKLTTSPIQKAALSAKVPPLILAPERVIFAENREPDWESLIVNRAAPKRYAIIGEEKDQKFSGQVKDRFFQLSSNFSIEIVRIPISALQIQNKNILILTTSATSPIDFSSDLSRLLGPTNQVKKYVFQQAFSRTEEVRSELAEELNNLPPSEMFFDCILLDLFTENICGGDVFPFAANDFYIKLAQFIQLIQKKYPKSQLLLIYPPAPVGECLYPVAANGRLNLLKHYRIIQLLENFRKSYKHFDLKPVILYCSLNFDTDFTWERKFNAHATPLGIMPSGRRKLSEDIAANIVYYTHTD